MLKTYLTRIEVPFNFEKLRKALKGVSPSPQYMYCEFPSFNIIITKSGFLRVFFQDSNNDYKEILEIAEVLGKAFSEQKLKIDPQKLLLKSVVVSEDLSVEALSLVDFKGIRPRLGEEINVNLLRGLMHITLYEELGAGAYNAVEDYGAMLGKKTFEYCGKKIANFPDAKKALSKEFLEHGFGILSFKQGKTGDEDLLIALDESISSSGLAPVGRKLCFLEKGFIKGFLSSFFGKEVCVSEEECWGMGANRCIFKVVLEA
jgi:predicted hydrocarbon binding protein